MSVLEPNETVVSDNGYRHGQCITDNELSEIQKPLHRRIGARHRTRNDRIKQINYIEQTFLHCLSLHGRSFHAVKRVVDVALQNGRGIFEW